MYPTFLIIAIVPKVIIRDGTLMIVTPIPFKKPQKVPAKRVKIITIKEELLSTNKPPNAHENAAIEPTDKSFKDAIKCAQEGDFDGFVAVGGGSSMDTAKDKSISPSIITIVIPKAMMPNTITVLIMF